MVSVPAGRAAGYRSQRLHEPDQIATGARLLGRHGRHRGITTPWYHGTASLLSQVTGIRTISKRHKEVAAIREAVAAPGSAPQPPILGEQTGSLSLEGRLSLPLGEPLLLLPLREGWGEGVTLTAPATASP